jgi:hypothetical protein
MASTRKARLCAAAATLLVACSAAGSRAAEFDVPIATATAEQPAIPSSATPASRPDQQAPATPPTPYGYLSGQIFGDALAKRGIGLFGWGEASLVASDTGHSNILPAGFFNQKTGFNLNQLGMMLCSGAACPPFVFGPQSNVLNRIGPFPGPKSDEITVDFNLTVVYGRDADFLRTMGLDDFKFDRNQDDKLAIPQAFVDVHLPILDGTDVIAGSFQTPLEADIGYPFTPPNWFASHTYAFEHGPAKHVGVLVQTKLPTSPGFGLLSVEYGAVRGWNNASEPNHDWDAIGLVHWRSADMKTWVDLEGIYGNGNGEFGPGPATGGSPYYTLSSTGKYLRRYDTFLVVRRTLSPTLQVAAELNYGHHDAGDLAPALIFFTRNADWRGANVSLRKQLSSKLVVDGRVEWFEDRQGAQVLWAGSPGKVTAITGNAEWQLNPFLKLRPELRYDRFDGRPGALPLFADHTSKDQLIGLLDLVTYF